MKLEELPLNNEIIEILNIDYEDFFPLLDMNKDDIINVDEFERLVLMLRQKNIHPIVHAEMVAELVPHVHNVMINESAESCESCHSKDSPFFQSVNIVLTKDNGTVDHHQVDIAVLESFNISHFYAWGVTRVRLLDKIGLVMIASAFSVICLHLQFCPF